MSKENNCMQLATASTFSQQSTVQFMDKENYHCYIIVLKVYNTHMQVKAAVQGLTTSYVIYS
jgi:hypothetical protein